MQLQLAERKSAAGEGASGQVCVSIINGSTAGRTISVNYTTLDGSALGN